jgi:transposase
MLSILIIFFAFQFNELVTIQQHVEAREIERNADMKFIVKTALNSKTEVEISRSKLNFFTYINTRVNKCLGVRRTHIKLCCGSSYSNCSKKTTTKARFDIISTNTAADSTLANRSICPAFNYTVVSTWFQGKYSFLQLVITKIMNL